MYADYKRHLQKMREWRKSHRDKNKEYMANYRREHPWNAANNRGRIELLRMNGIRLKIVENKDAIDKKTGTWTVYPRLVASNPDCFNCGKSGKFGVIITKKIRTPSIHLRFPFHKALKYHGLGSEPTPVEFPDGSCLHDTFDDFDRAADLAYFGRQCRCSFLRKHGLTLNAIYYTHGFCAQCILNLADDSWIERVQLI